MNTNDINEASETVGRSSQATAGGLNPYYRASLPSSDRLIHLAMDELAAARAEAQSEHFRADTATYQAQKLSEEMRLHLRRLQEVTIERGEALVVADQRAEEITALKVSLAVVKSQLEAIESDPTKRRINQLLRRIHQLAPNRQFKVVLRGKHSMIAELPVLSVNSSNGVTTLTVLRKLP